MPKRLSEQGTALATVLMLTTVLSLLLASSAYVVMGAQKNTREQFVREGQANNVARAGLQAGLSWFKTQVAQPVRQDPLDITNQPCVHAAFFPRENTTDITLGETIDESVGLVKEFKLQEPNLYGRYTIKRFNCDENDNAHLLWNELTEWNKHAARDVTFERGKQDGNTPLGQGVVWYLESEGLIYQKNDAAKAPEESPNRLIQKGYAAVEINRVSISVPKSPINLTGVAGDNSNFNNNCEINGDTETIYGIVRNSTTSFPGGSFLFSIPGSATQHHQIDLGNGEFNKTVENTFNMTMPELKAVSDKVYTAVTEISKTEPIPFGMTFLDGGGTSTFSFNADRPLKGSGVLFVNGNLELLPDSNSAFSGLVYITGRLTMGASNSLGGALVARAITCTPATRATLEYNDNVMTNVRQRLGLYRQNNLTLNTFNR